MHKHALAGCNNAMPMDAMQSIIRLSFSYTDFINTVQVHLSVGYCHYQWRRRGCLENARNAIERQCLIRKVDRDRKRGEGGEGRKEGGWDEGYRSS